MVHCIVMHGYFHVLCVQGFSKMEGSTWTSHSPETIPQWPVDTPPWHLTHIDVENASVSVVTGLDPILEAALTGSIPADLRSFGGCYCVYEAICLQVQMKL